VTTEALPGLQKIDRDECLELLAGDTVGRLAVTDGRTPGIFPVNYLLDGDDIVFRTDAGTKVDVGPRARACFEIDAFDRRTHSGWSVVATGRLEEVTAYDARTWQRVQELPIEPWAGGIKAHWMRLVSERITGRRIPPPA
jgi:nitroimidazol reductase NimA-like FMN-containing flavoprotein (pyridoxamine 5'-phosphate oxidase superfamily)